MIHVIMPMGWFLMTPIGACVQCNIRRLLGKHPVSPPPSPPPEIDIHTDGDVYHVSIIHIRRGNISPAFEMPKNLVTTFVF